jgi:hypothetical protein
MPAREIPASFWRDWDRLTPQQQRAFRQAVAQFIVDIACGGQLPSASARQAGTRLPRREGDDLSAGRPRKLRVRRRGSAWRAAHYLAAYRHALSLPPAVSVGKSPTSVGAPAVRRIALPDGLEAGLLSRSKKRQRADIHLPEIAGVDICHAQNVLIRVANGRVTGVERNPRPSSRAKR